jgi:dihydrolipoamide dehydrogenase
LKTAIIEKNARFGGTCLNIGCIPSKALLDSTGLLVTVRNKTGIQGIIIENESIKVDLKQMMKRKEDIVTKMTDGIKALLTNYKVDTYNGKGILKDNKTITVVKEDGSITSVSGRNIILATGSVPLEIPSMPYDGKFIVDSTKALSFDDIPANLAIIGAGAIGLEMGSIWARLGSKVTIIEMADQILPRSDARTCNRLHQILNKQGMDIRVSTRVVSADVDKGNVKIVIEDKNKIRSEINCGKVLVAAGRKPFINYKELDEMGIKYDVQTKRIAVNAKFRTSVENIYAIGDIIPGPMLAHKAEEEGAAAAEVIAVGFGEVDYDAIPSIVYTSPEYASVGKNEDELVKRGVQYKSGLFQFRANGRALADENTEGFVKIFADAKTDRLLGAEIIGHRASELIGELVTVMEFKGNSEDIARTIHSHPTLSEVVMEAAKDVQNRSIHSMPKLKKNL